MQDLMEKKSAIDKVTLPVRLHHTAWVVEDQERTRAFYEDILGFELTAFWIEKGPPSRGKRLIMSHAFYGLPDGSALAFFCMAEPEDHDVFKSPKTEAFNHIALNVDEATLDRLQQALAAAGYPHHKMEHGYCTSLYATDPDGLRLEFAKDDTDVDRINAEQRRDARGWMEKWNAGHREPNNQLYTTMVERVGPDGTH